jgi:UDP-N-acetylmuramyl pentapeptide phosphotransferase/UDP-N-acetylglucosamine-1-phosphate transferase
MDWLVSGILFSAVFAASLALTGLVAAQLRRRAILDRPNARSSHAVPTPRGGGIAVLAVVLPVWALIALATTPRPAAAFAMLASAAALAVLSFLDDLHSLSPHWRLAVQAGAVAFALVGLPADAPVFQGLLSPGLDRLAAGLAWVWFINLFNFMDGIDGIAGSETAAIAGGLFLVAALVPGALGPAHGVAFLGLSLAAAALGFLWWNWAPAQVFLGDVGSVPIGFLLGWLLLQVAAAGAWAVALILPLYYLADATITLLRRLFAGERIWRAHSRHFYQRAARGPLGHAGVVRAVVAANLVLMALAVLAAAGRPVPALAGACVAVAALLLVLSRRAAPDPASAGGADPVP